MAPSDKAGYVQESRNGHMEGDPIIQDNLTVLCTTALRPTSNTSPAQPCSSRLQSQLGHALYQSEQEPNYRHPPPPAPLQIHTDTQHKHRGRGAAAVRAPGASRRKLCWNLELRQNHTAQGLSPSV